MAMFSFSKWHDWMQSWAEAHRGEVVTLEFTARSDFSPAVAMGFSTTEVVASFSFWDTALADFDVMDIATQQWLANEAGITLDDENFELEFSRFLAIAGFGLD